MDTRSEHEPARTVVFEARPAVRTDAPGSFARRTGGLMAVLFTISVFGLLVLGGNVVWTMVETPDRPPAPPSWMEPVQHPEREAQPRERETTSPRPSTGPATGSGSSSGEDSAPSPAPTSEVTSGSDDEDAIPSSGTGSGPEGTTSSPGDSSGSGSDDVARSPGDSSGSGSDGDRRERESRSGSGSDSDSSGSDH